MVQAVILPGALKSLHVPGLFHHADHRGVPLGAGAHRAQVSVRKVLADAAPMQPGVRTADGIGQRRSVLIRHTQHLIGHAGSTLAAHALKLAELLDQLFQRCGSVVHGISPSRLRDPECSGRR